MNSTTKIQQATPTPDHDLPSSSCSESTETHLEHDVFLSFRGEDTRNTFTDHLKVALVEKGIHTFMDADQLPVGRDVKQNLLDAIRKSRMAVIVLSINYASSTWCLDELVEIVRSMEERGMRVLPIFYHVAPSDVRHQKETFGRGFAEYEKQHCKNVGKWRSALTKVANLSGIHIQHGPEAQFIKGLVEMIFRELIYCLPPSAIPVPTTSGFSITINDALKKKNEQLNQALLREKQEVLKLRNQVESVSKRCESQKQELQKYATELKEVMARAEKQYAELNKSLSAKLKDMSLRPLPPGKQNNEPIKDSEWLEEYMLGVYITLQSMRDGTTKLKRLQFSRKLFDEQGAETWRSKNLDELYKRVNNIAPGPDIALASRQVDANNKKIRT